MRGALDPYLPYMLAIAAASFLYIAASNLDPVVQHDDEWPDPPESLPSPYDNRLSQPYGGYISPGSTLDELRIFVSQWDTQARQDGPYRVIQYAVNPFKP